MQRQPVNLRDLMGMMQNARSVQDAADLIDGTMQQPQVTRVQARQQPSTTTGRGHARGGVDNGTVALAMSGMSFYWSMPMMMAMAKKKRRRKPAARATTPEPSSTANADAPAADRPISGEPYA